MKHVREAITDDFIDSCALKPAKARKTDPDTSHEAAKSVTRSGKQKAHAKLCLDFVRSHPGHTAPEIGDAIGLDRYIVGRRLPELREVGKLVNGDSRKCQIHGTNMMTWYPKQQRGLV